MDRSCSWWNPGQGLAPTGYVLEHEQIHFALMEIFARRINRQIRNLRMRVASREAAPSVARANLTTLLEAAKKGYLAESRHFDEQTSHPPDPGSQARWRHQVETRLREVER